MESPHRNSQLPDVLVVGGGLIGTLSALRLAEAGLRVTVLERSIPGAEASSAAAGILAAQSESPADDAVFALSMESVRAYAHMAAEAPELHGFDLGYRRCGVLETAPDAAGLDALEQKFGWQRARGLRVERLDGNALRAMTPALSPALAGALWFPDDAQLDPVRLMAALARSAERVGVVFRTGVTVRGVLSAGDRCTGLDTDAGPMSSGAVLVAAGAWSPLVAGCGLASDDVRPARGQIVELQMRTPPAGPVVFGLGGYVVPRPDGKVLCGSTLEFVGFRAEVTAAGVHKVLTTALGLLPVLGEARVTRTWSNFRPHAPAGAPLVGATQTRGLFVATGHHRSGILLAPATARLVTDLIAHNRRDAAHAALDPQRIPPGASA